MSIQNSLVSPYNRQYSNPNSINEQNIKAKRILSNQSEYSEEDYKFNSVGNKLNSKLTRQYSDDDNNNKK